MQEMKADECEQKLEPIFVYFRESKETEESFGDFCNRVGFDAIREYTANYEIKAVAPEVSDDSEGKVEKMADSITAEATEESQSKAAAKDSTTIPKKLRHRVTVRDEVYDKLKQASENQGKPMTEMVNEAIKAYLGAE